MDASRLVYPVDCQLDCVDCRHTPRALIRPRHAHTRQWLIQPLPALVSGYFRRFAGPSLGNFLAYLGLQTGDVDLVALVSVIPDSLVDLGLEIIGAQWFLVLVRQ